jgi:hypothetical protein
VDSVNGMYEQIFGDMKYAHWWTSDEFCFDVHPSFGIVPLQPGSGKVSVSTISPMSNVSALLR